MGVIMNDKLLKEKQEILNKEKYFKSQEVGCDMSGCMDWCNNCIFQNIIFKKCDLNHESREINTVCARHTLREEEKNVIREPFDKQNTETRRRTTKKCKTKSSDLQNV